MDTIDLLLPYYKINDTTNFPFVSPSLFEYPYKAPFYDKENKFYSVYKKENIKGTKQYLPTPVLYTNRRLYGCSPYLYIEFSIPKLLFGNNYKEVTNKDLKKLPKKLVKKLKLMGIITTEEAIKKARIEKLHFGKNFLLPDELTLKTLFDSLPRVKFPRLKGKPLYYDNGGTGYKFYCKSYSILFYDKMSELSLKHPDLVERLKKKGINNLLRMEIQINNRLKLENTITGLGHKGNNTFENFVRTEKLKSVLEKFLWTLHKNAPLIFMRERNPLRLFQSIKSASITEKSKIFTLLTLQQSIGRIGTQELFSCIKLHGSKGFLKKYNQEISTNIYLQNIFLKLLSIVKDYKPIQNSKFDKNKFINFKL